jgi:hypothetical protein
LYAGTTGFFAREFGLDAKETVALLGAHSLGRALPNNSGFKVGNHKIIKRKNGK